MREIKFKIWDKTMNRWWCEDSQYLQMDGTKIHPAPWSTLSANLPDGCIEILQYTGLKDKNNVEIYEGDIVKLFNDPDELYEVVYNCFDNDILGFLLESDGGRGDWFDSKKREVVGNIFENPELLK